MCSYITTIEDAEKNAAPRHTAHLSVLSDELLGGVIRERFHHLAEGCLAPTRDVCHRSCFFKLPMQLPSGQSSVTLEELWRRHWAAQYIEKASERDASSCCQGIADNMRQEYLEKEPACMILALDRLGPDNTKRLTAVDFPELSLIHI